MRLEIKEDYRSALYMILEIVNRMTILITGIRTFFLTNFFTFSNNYQIHLYDMLYGVEIYWLVKLLLLTKTDEPAI